MATKTIVRYRNPRRRAIVRRAAKTTFPVAVLAGLAVPAIDIWKNGLGQGDFQRAGITATAIFTGYNPESHTWELSYLKRGLLPVVAGMAVHKFIGGSLGVNRMLARAKVPFIRL